MNSRQRSLLTKVSSFAIASAGFLVPAFAQADVSARNTSAEFQSEYASPLSVDLLAAFNGQTGHEMEAAYTYLNVANHFNEKNLEGMGRWFTAQFYEEINHARQFMNFIKSKGQNVVLTPLRALEFQRTTPLEIFRQGLKAEEAQTKRIQALYQKALAAGDYTAVSFLKFFLDEQVQEEDMFTNIVDRLELLAGDPTGILALDRELGARAIPAAFVPKGG